MGICSRAARFAVKDAIAAEEAERQKMDPEHPNYIEGYETPEDFDPVPEITNAHFAESMKYARRSVSDIQLRQYEMIAQNQLSRVGLDFTANASTTQHGRHYDGWGRRPVRPWWRRR